MQSSKLGISERGFQLLIEGIWKRYLFCHKWYIKGLGVRPRLVEDAPGEQVISNIKDTMLYITQILRISAGVGSRKNVATTTTTTNALFAWP